MRVICVDDTRKPKTIPPEKWIKKDAIYTIIATSSMNIQRNKIGLKLKEIDLDQSCFPYEYFDADRFKLLEFENELVKEQEETFTV